MFYFETIDRVTCQQLQDQCHRLYIPLFNCSHLVPPLASLFPSWLLLCPLSSWKSMREVQPMWHLQQVHLAKAIAQAVDWLLRLCNCALFNVTYVFCWHKNCCPILNLSNCETFSQVFSSSYPALKTTLKLTFVLWPSTYRLKKFWPKILSPFPLTQWSITECPTPLFQLLTWKMLITQLAYLHKPPCVTCSVHTIYMKFCPIGKLFHPPCRPFWTRQLKIGA